MFEIEKMSFILTCIITLIKLSVQHQEEEDCTGSIIYDTNVVDNCQNNIFRSSPTLESKFGQNVPKCCTGHSYMFYLNCEVSTTILTGLINQLKN